MKKTVIMLAAAALIFATPSCKKGENDPFLSLLSRRARISGDWILSAYMSESTWSDGSGDSSTSSAESTDGKTLTTSYSYTSSGTTTTWTSTTTIDDASWTINKDGTYSMTMNTTTVTTQDLGGGWSQTDTETEKSSESGSWSFVGKAKDEYKNKERVVFNTTESSYSTQTTTVISDGSTSTETIGDTDKYDDIYSIGDNAVIYDINQLKNKEIILKQIGDGSNTYTNISGSTTVSSTDTYTGETTLTLTAK